MTGWSSGLRVAGPTCCLPASSWLALHLLLPLLSPTVFVLCRLFCLRPEGLGFCLEATVRFVPSYSTSLRCEGCAGSDTLYDASWRLTDAAAEW